MEDAGACVGICAFLLRENEQSVVQVQGRIKAQPEDFVVREISADHEVLDLPEQDGDERVPTEQDREAVLQRLIAAKEAAAVSSSAQKKPRLEFAEPAQGWRHALSETIGESNVASVTEVAAQSREQWLLDAPTEQRDRIFLQICIQNCFPGLECRMAKAAETTEAVEQQPMRIEVTVDPLFKKLRAGGMAIENCNRVLTYLRHGATHAEAPRGVELVHDDTKDARSLIHRLISKHSSCLKSKTDGKRLVVYFSEKHLKKRKRTQPDVYLRFVLKKTNEEHFVCFEKLARALKRPVSAFSVAGTKDKVAITYQHVVVAQGVTPRQLLELNRRADNERSRIRVGKLEYVGAPMALGSAKGNRFTIRVRELRSEGEIRPSIIAAVEQVSRMGFINYFGFQRVGNPTSPLRPHHIGELLIASKWEQAVKLLLTPTSHDSESVSSAKRIYLDQGDIDASLKALPLQHTQVERAVLQGLKRYGKDAYEQAISNVPFARRVMYLHSYQSFLFNEMASFRIAKYGSKLVQGDLVRDEDSGAKVIDTEEAQKLNAEHANALTLAVLPLVGTNVILPSNEVQAKCNELMETHGTREGLCASGSVKGAYRSLVAVPDDMKCEWVDAQDEAVELSFSLPSGSFATMCLREIFKTHLHEQQSAE